MKRFFLVVTTVAALTAAAYAGGPDTHIGLGYHAQYFGAFADLNTDFADDSAWMPYGISTYAGLGYGFGARELINIGIEPAFALGFSIKDGLSVADLVVQGRAYLKFRPAAAFTVAAYGGVSYDLYGAVYNGESFSKDAFAPLAGGRITLLFLYAQYDMTFYPGESPMRQSFGAGFAFKR